jgi:hypothetical protein
MKNNKIEFETTFKDLVLDLNKQKAITSFLLEEIITLKGFKTQNEINEFLKNFENETTLKLKALLKS